ncbi:MAG TPA: hypothetical protein VGN57_01475 [Pirellulaceae bacterium]|jgi:hypothetical protein|nr:hypothetical protein [Pirellulaceae bacterium]
MFAWIKSFINATALPSLQSVHEALSGPGTFLDVVVGRSAKRIVGSLELPSGVVVLMDPCSDSVVEVSGFVERRAIVVVEEFHDPVEEMRNPSFNAVLRRIELVFDPDAPVDKTRKLGALEIESARIAAADRDDWKRHRQEVGPLRELRMNARFDPDGKIRFAIMNEFGVAWRAIDLHRLVYAATRPVEQDEYVAMQRAGWLAAGNAPPVDEIYPSFGLTHVTGSTFDRMNEFRGIGFLPIGDPEGPAAFLGLSGRGEGTYEVVGQFAEDRIVRVEIRFREDSG